MTSASKPASLNLLLAITNASTDVPRAIEEEQSARKDMMARNGNGYHLAPRIQRRGRIERVARRERMAADGRYIPRQSDAGWISIP